MTENLKGFEIRKSFQLLPLWKGEPIQNTYGNKPVLNYNGKPLFAELFALRQFNEKGYNGVWADTYRRKFRTELPEVNEPIIQLPVFIQEKLNDINPNGKLNGTWDLILWKENEIKFIELKRKGKDRIQQSQIDFFERALNIGLLLDSFEIFEWTECDASTSSA